MLVFEEEKKIALCRVCLNFDCSELGGGLSLFEKYNDVYVYEKINYIASIEIVQDDYLPNMICSVCLVALDNACNFKRQCETSDAFLHSTSQTSEHLQAQTEVPIKEEIYLEEDYDNDFTKEDSLSPSEEHQSDDVTTDSKEDITNKEPKLKPFFISKAINLKLECHDCGEIFKSKCKLKVHWKKVHLPRQLICPICKQTHRTFKSFHNHMKRKSQSCVNAAKVRVEGEGKSRTFHCKECDASSKRIQTIIAHLVTHTGERPFTCNICNKSFSQQSGLTGHNESVHKKYVKEVTCELCGKHFKGRSRWTRHVRFHKNIHLPCPVCNKILFSKEILKNHMKRHSGVKSYACEICAKTFYTSTDLRNHKVKTHFKNVTYSCDQCEYKTLNYNCMHKHRPRHTGNNVACNICGAFVDNEQQLALHKKRHLEKNLKCSYCEKFYYTKKSLASHVRKYHRLYGPGSKTPDKVVVKRDTESV